MTSLCHMTWQHDVMLLCLHVKLFSHESAYLLTNTHRPILLLRLLTPEVTKRGDKEVQLTVKMRQSKPNWKGKHLWFYHDSATQLTPNIPYPWSSHHVTKIIKLWCLGEDRGRHLGPASVVALNVYLSNQARTATFLPFVVRNWEQSPVKLACVSSDQIGWRVRRQGAVSLDCS